MLKVSLIALAAGCAVASSAFALTDIPTSNPPHTSVMDIPTSNPPHTSVMDIPTSNPPHQI